MRLPNLSQTTTRYTDYIKENIQELLSRYQLEYAPLVDEILAVVMDNSPVKIDPQAKSSTPQYNRDIQTLYYKLQDLKDKTGRDADYINTLYDFLEQFKVAYRWEEHAILGGLDITEDFTEIKGSNIHVMDNQFQLKNSNLDFIGKAFSYTIDTYPETYAEHGQLVTALDQTPVPYMVTHTGKSFLKEGFLCQVTIDLQKPVVLKTLLLNTGMFTRLQQVKINDVTLGSFTPKTRAEVKINNSRDLVVIPEPTQAHRITLLLNTVRPQALQPADGQYIYNCIIESLQINIDYPEQGALHAGAVTLHNYEETEINWRGQHLEQTMGHLKIGKWQVPVLSKSMDPNKTITEWVPVIDTGTDSYIIPSFPAGNKGLGLPKGHLAKMDHRYKIADSKRPLYGDKVKITYTIIPNHTFGFVNQTGELSAIPDGDSIWFVRITSRDMRSASPAYTHMINYYEVPPLRARVYRDYTPGQMDTAIPSLSLPDKPVIPYTDDTPVALTAKTKSFKDRTNYYTGRIPNLNFYTPGRAIEYYVQGDKLYFPLNLTSGDLPDRFRATYYKPLTQGTLDIVLTCSQQQTPSIAKVEL